MDLPARFCPSERVKWHCRVPRPMRTVALLVLTLSLFLAGCTAGDDRDSSPTTAGSLSCEPNSFEPPTDWKAEAPRVKLETTMGDIVGELDVERAPITAGNFLNLTRQGYFDGIQFHRVIDGFVIQGGDPNTKPGGDASRIGAGGPGYEIPDEFNPQLRHDEEGVFSMATSGPDTGGSQFFITLAPTPNLDDRHSVFGRVVEGMDVVRAIGKVATDEQDRPTSPVTITKASLVDARAYDAAHAVGLQPVIKEKKAEAQRPVTFAVVLKNEGNVRDAIGVRAVVPSGWSCSVNERPVVPAGTGRVVFVTVTPGQGATGTHDVDLVATSAWNGTAEAATKVKVTIATLGRAVKDGDSVTANYAGFLPDGRLFDTSMEAVGTDTAMPKFETPGGWSGKTQYSPFPFTVGGGVIQGFTDLAKTAKEGETVTMRIPKEDAYAQGNMYQRPLTGRDLVFELEIVKINS